MLTLGWGQGSSLSTGMQPALLLLLSSPVGLSGSDHGAMLLMHLFSCRDGPPTSPCSLLIPSVLREKGAHYTDGYTQDHKTIKQFWEVAHALSESDKRNLLMFTTGCDRAPIQGLASLKFTISRHGTPPPPPWGPSK